MADSRVTLADGPTHHTPLHRGRGSKRAITQSIRSYTVRTKFSAAPALNHAICDAVKL